MMGLGYPGGPVIDRLAKLGDPNRFKFAKPQIPGLDYSFSGVKTSLLYFVRDEMAKDPEFMEKNKEDICASFQKTLIDIQQRAPLPDRGGGPQAWLEHISPRV